jgi:hypothetical protein
MQSLNDTPIKKIKINIFYLIKKKLLNQFTYNIFNANRHKYINHLFYEQNHMSINISMHSI